MIEKAQKNPKIEFIMNAVVVDVLGKDRVTGVKLKDTGSGDVSDLAVEGMFVAIGHTPRTSLFTGQLDIDANGYITTCRQGNRFTATNIPGVFACGDVQDSIYRQAISAAGSGCMAAIDAERYLEVLEMG
jgi:thioredoxin reductase (NADPH)